MRDLESRFSPGKTSARVRAGKTKTGTSEAHMLDGLSWNLAGHANGAGENTDMIWASISSRLENRLSS